MGQDNTPKQEVKNDNFGLQVIKKTEEEKKVEAPKMVSIALDGYGNRVFVSEKKEKAFKEKLGLK